MDRARLEKQAYDVESAVIDSLCLALPTHLANLVTGHGHYEFGLAGTDVIASLYEAPPAPEITGPSLLIRIRQLWTPQMTAEALYEATHGWWRLGEHREHAKYAFAVSRGVVRAVYRIQRWRARVEGDRGWERDVGGRPRWGFDGSPAPEMKVYLNTSVRHYFTKGAQSPTLYLNCRDE